MGDVLLYGPMAYRPLLQAVLDREVEDRPVNIKNHVVISTGADYPATLVRAADQVADCRLVGGLSPEDVSRIDHFAGSLSLVPAELVLPETGGPVRVYLPVAVPGGGMPFDLDAWVSAQGALTVALAGDVMALRGLRTPAQIAGRIAPMLVRAQSRLRAGGGPAELRHDATNGDTQVSTFREPYAHFFAVEEYDMSWRQFDGAMSPVANRAVFISGDAVTVLPYDPVRDRVIVIEQFRAGPFARGDTQPWQIEAIAGRIDPGETPQAAARREAVEEAGLVLGQLLPVAGYYPSPAAKSEYLYSFVALADLPDGSAGVFGLDEEAEDIRGHLLSFDRLIALVDSGEIANAPLVLTALWLQRERGRLRT